MVMVKVQLCIMGHGKGRDVLIYNQDRSIHSQHPLTGKTAKDLYRVLRKLGNRLFMTGWQRADGQFELSGEVQPEQGW